MIRERISDPRIAIYLYDRYVYIFIYYNEPSSIRSNEFVMELFLSGLYVCEISNQLNITERPFGMLQKWLIVTALTKFSYPGSTLYLAHLPICLHRQLYKNRVNVS